MRAEKPPPVFVSYRRADEPFAAALAHAVLTERWDGDPVFLDTRFLRQRGTFRRELLDAVRGCSLVLAVIGPRWDDDERKERLADEKDWVRVELEEATRAGVPIVPVLVDRPDPPHGLPLRPEPAWEHPVHLGSSTFWDAVGPLADRVARTIGDPDRDGAGRTRSALTRSAVEAMLRHVLPSPQRSTDNDVMIARVVTDHLDDGEWLRFVATANRPGRPTGSCVVWVTSEFLTAADLGSNVTPRVLPEPVRRDRVRLTGRVNRRRLGLRRVSDLRFEAGDRTVELLGLFEHEADELLDALARPRD